jgi:aspartate/methionine/tyrosine aminotransferase
MFSARTNWPKELNPLAAALEQRRGRGLPILDLTESNPTVAGFDYPNDAILHAVANVAAMEYEPNPRGLLAARQAVAGYYAASGGRVDPERILLTTGTSEAYSHAMRLLANPGDEILCPSPSYPLFDLLADVNDVKLVHYPLIYDHGWGIDLARLHGLISDRCRAILVVNPNNPTGSYLRDEEAAALIELARERDLALVVDEVFRDYSWEPGSAPPKGCVRTTAAIDSCLTLTLNGLSKLSALPQMKLAWMIVSGPPDIVADAMERLDILSDTFLSVSALVQHGAATWIEQGASVRSQILGRVSENLLAMDNSLSRGGAVDRLTAEGGWYAILRVPNVRSDEEWAMELLETDGVYVHPGHFFGFAQEGYLVVSLLPESSKFREGVEKLLRRVRGS